MAATMFMMIGALLSPFTTHRFLLSQLTQREIKARYKQSFIGYAWVVVNPLTQLLVYTFVFSHVFRFQTEHVPYSMFLFSGLLPWTYLQTSLAASANSLVENASLLRKVAFPRETIPYAVVAGKLIDLGFAAIIFLLLTLFLGIELSWRGLLVLPLFIGYILLTAGLSLLLSAANLFYRDVQYLTSLFLMVWMYLTPIVYPFSLVPSQYRFLAYANPLVGYIEGYRALLFGESLSIPLVVWSVAFSIIVFAFGWLTFRRLSPVFSDIV